MKRFVVVRAEGYMTSGPANLLPSQKIFYYAVIALALTCLQH